MSPSSLSQALDWPYQSTDSGRTRDDSLMPADRFEPRFMTLCTCEMYFLYVCLFVLCWMCGCVCWSLCVLFILSASEGQI